MQTPSTLGRLLRKIFTLAGSFCRRGHLRKSRTGLVIVAAVICVAGLLIAAPKDKEEPVSDDVLQPLVTEDVPLLGSFWLVSQTNLPPFPFDPVRASGLTAPVYGLGGNSFLIDDRGVDYPSAAVQDGSGGMQTMSSPPEPPGQGIGEDPGTTNSPPAFLTSTNVCLLPPVFLSSNSILLVVTNGGTNAFDLLNTTNLSPDAPGLNLTNWAWLARGQAGQSNFTVSVSGDENHYQLGTMQDSDGGGLADALEHKVTHTDPDDPADDHLVPLVGIRVLDSIAVEGSSTNTAQFRVSRLGGYMNQSLTVLGNVTGSATFGSDYTLSPISYLTNAWITIPAGQTSVVVTLTATNDAVAEGSETATLTLSTNLGGCDLDEGHSSATAWILEQYTRVYTLDGDFELGVMAGLEAVSNQLQFKTNLPAQFPFINVACSARGTVARINTTNGQVVGEYRTAPDGLTFTGDSGEGPQPSRTTVDLFGNIWGCQSR